MSGRYERIRREVKTIERLADIGEALEEGLGAEVEVRRLAADEWTYEGDDSGYTLGDYLRADREGRLIDGKIVSRGEADEIHRSEATDA